MMKLSRVVLCAAFVALSGCPAFSQMPVLGNIEAPYPNLQGGAKIGGVTYGSGAVAYGAVGTPLILTGSDLGDSGTVQFVGYKNGVPDPGYTVQATVTMWSSAMLFLTVPSGATSGMVTVTVEQKTSNGLPFVVTPGAYSGSCPVSPPNNQLQITTASLHDGTAGQSYSATLGATGGTTPYAWSLIGGTLPSGLSLSSAGILSGTPTAAAGPMDLTIQAVDSSSPPKTDQTVLSLTIQSQSLVAATVYSYCVPGPYPNCSGSAGSGFDNDGNVTQYQDTIMGAWSFQYDTLNRLMIGSSSSGPYASQNACWSYDVFGNRTAQTLQSATCPTPETSVPPTVQYSTSNQITFVQNSAPNGFAYDAAGDTTADNLNQYLYDAEGRVCALKSSPIAGISTAVGYLYDAEGHRIAKGTVANLNSCDPAVNGFQLTESYVLGQGGEQLAIFDGHGTWQRSNVYAASRLIATYDLVSNPNGTSPSQVAALHFHLTDPLGTRRLQTSSVGQPETDCQSLPFGDQMYCFPDANAPGTADDATPLHFTGKERDAESGNDYFGARYYANAMGRFLSPDPMGPWVADAGDPQSWNLYAYARNNPLINIDPTGLDCVYFKDDGDEIEDVDRKSNSDECGKNGGDWINGTLRSAQYFSDSDTWGFKSNDANYSYLTFANAPGTETSGNDCYGNCDLANGYVQSKIDNSWGAQPISPFAFQLTQQVAHETAPIVKAGNCVGAAAVAFSPVPTPEDAKSAGEAFTDQGIDAGKEGLEGLSEAKKLAVLGSKLKVGEGVRTGAKVGGKALGIAGKALAVHSAYDNLKEAGCLGGSNSHE